MAMCMFSGLVWGGCFGIVETALVHMHKNSPWAGVALLCRRMYGCSPLGDSSKLFPTVGCPHFHSHWCVCIHSLSTQGIVRFFHFHPLMGVK